MAKVLFMTVNKNGARKGKQGDGTATASRRYRLLPPMQLGDGSTVAVPPHSDGVLATMESAWTPAASSFRSKLFTARWRWQGNTQRGG